MSVTNSQVFLIVAVNSSVIILGWITSEFRELRSQQRTTAMRAELAAKGLARRLERLEAERKLAPLSCSRLKSTP